VARLAAAGPTASKGSTGGGCGGAARGGPVRVATAEEAGKATPAARASASGASAGSGPGAGPSASTLALLHEPVTLEGRGGRFTVNRGHYQKLCELHARFASTGTGRGGAAAAGAAASASGEAFARDEAILALLLRYNALSGGAPDGSGGGMQGAIHGELFDCLKLRLGVTMECFASPLNCRFGRYCSAFPDTDGCFGSLGSFFDFWPLEGSFEANPPFVPAVRRSLDKIASPPRVLDPPPSLKNTLLITFHRPLPRSSRVILTSCRCQVVEDMARHMEALLQRSCDAAGPRPLDACTDGSLRPLSFVVVIPHCDEQQHTRAPKAIRPVLNGRGEVAVATQRRAVPEASLPGWKLLRHSKFAVKHILVAAQEHGYCEGSQHVRRTRFKTSRFATSVFILQNGAARRAWPVDQAVCRAVRAAFASKFEAELEGRRKLAVQGPGGAEGGGGGSGEEEEEEDEEDEEEAFGVGKGHEASKGQEESAGVCDEEEGAAGEEHASPWLASLAGPVKAATPATAMETKKAKKRERQGSGPQCDAREASAAPDLSATGNMTKKTAKKKHKAVWQGFAGEGRTDKGSDKGCIGGAAPSARARTEARGAMATAKGAKKRKAEKQMRRTAMAAGLSVVN